MDFNLKHHWVMPLVVALTLTAAPMVVLAATQPNDDTISFWVREALNEDDRVPSAEIVITTKDGVVTLSGTVENLAAKHYATLETEKVDGVRSVVDELTVTPLYRSDTDIVQNVRRRLIGSSTIKSQGLAVSASDGVVTLSGTVASWPERDQAELLASEVWGVKGVTNLLAIEYTSKRPDDDIRKDIVSGIDRDVYLSGLPITVTVKDGVVTLDGEVGNAYQKRRAMNDAVLVWNVKQVNNDLRIEWWQDAGVRKQQPVLSDAQTHDAVHAELKDDPRVDASGVRITAVGGYVTLRGSVPTVYEKRIAEQDARDVIGVAWVNNMLDVSMPMRDDLAIKDDVDFVLNTDYALSGDGLKAGVRNGVVTLTGNVNTFFEKARAAELAERIFGVREINNDVTVNWSNRYTDKALTDRVTARLAANAETRPADKEIAVSVHDGKVTLTGRVDYWSERDAAGRVAFLTDGVWAVDNDLTVKNWDYNWSAGAYAWPDDYDVTVLYPDYVWAYYDYPLWQ